MPNRSTSQRPSTLAHLGLFLAVAAIAVNAPRLILVFLEAEGVPVSAELRVGLLALTGIATGVVLTGGGAFLAHAVAWGRHFRRILVVAWLIVLVATGILITPMLAAGLAHAPLTAVLASSSSRWIWSAVAVLAVELVAAGSMVAYAAHRREDQDTGDLEQELLDIAAERNRLSGELDQLRGDFEAERAEMLEEVQQLESDLNSRSQGSTPKSFPCRNGCGREFASPAAERGHQKGCPQRTAF
jgi:MFS family permease